MKYFLIRKYENLDYWAQRDNWVIESQFAWKTKSKNRAVQFLIL